MRKIWTWQPPVGFGFVSSSVSITDVATEVPNVRLTNPSLAQSETSIAEPPSTQQDGVAQITEGLDMTNLLLNTSATVGEQVLVT